jgi:hypothetical protein
MENKDWCNYSGMPSPSAWETRTVNMIETLVKLSSELLKVELTYGDVNDLGNEIGYHLSKILTDMTDEEVDLFIRGFKHGVEAGDGIIPK